MKHSIAVKFIAIALCAAALLTAAGSGLGIALLASHGLYDRTVQELRWEEMEDQAFSFAQQTAQNYASTQLGGCPEEMVGNFHYFNAGSYGYVLKNEKGQVLETLDLDAIADPEKALYFTQMVSGSYMKVVDSYPQAAEEEETDDSLVYHDMVYDADTLVYGFHVYQESGSTSISQKTPIGYLFHDDRNYLHFEALVSNLTGQMDLPKESVTGIEFQNNQGEPLFFASSANQSVGEFSLTSQGFLHFTAAFPTLESTPVVATDTATTETRDMEPTQAPETPLAAATESAPIASSDIEPTQAPDGAAGTSYIETPIPAATVPAKTETIMPTESYENVHYFSYWDDESQQDMTVEYVWEVMPTYTVDVTLLPNATYTDNFYTLAEIICGFRDMLHWLLAAGLLAFAVTAVYLCCAAGRRPGTDEVRVSGLNRLPLDLYLAGGGTAVCLLAILGYEGGEALFRGNTTVGLAFAGIMGYLMALVIVGFCFACAGQFKLRQGHWWKHMLLGWCLYQGMRFLRWVTGGLKFVVRGCRAVFKLLPVIWQWLVTAAAMVLLPFIALFFFANAWGFGEFFWGLLVFLSIAGDIAMVVYGGWCFGTLLKGAKAMAQGDLNHHIPTKYMVGAFREFGEDLNNLADAAYLAAEKQLKSERMKTELITNVSHDIKTPLTSIINFVDLLKKPHDEAQGAEYLEVLDRQSQRLKKLIDDLMDMSKASTGNMAVELGQVDAVEAVNQALGEFADKLSAAHLTPVFRHPEENVIITADGRLVWRVLSNLLGNAVKYALPDTRLYVDLMTLDGNAVLTIKNISREQLNMNAEELMERFVRGDASRNTEGSGLGLNIAKSLVEIQRGRIDLKVDGDLFKVTMCFPLV